MTSRPASELPAPIAVEPAPSAPPRAAEKKGRAIELLWAADSAESRARRVPALAELLGAPATAEDPDERREASGRQVLRLLSRMRPAEDLQAAFWDAVDEDGCFQAPLVLVTGELALLVDDAEYAKILAPMLRPVAESDGELGERIDNLVLTAERWPEASRLIERELSALERAWSEQEMPIPMEEIEADAKRALVKSRRFRTLSIFEATHLASAVHTEAHKEPLPVYLPEQARGRLPLEDRFDVRMLVQLFPRQIADEPSPLCGKVIALARVIRG